MEQDNSEFSNQVRVMQIIASALTAGVVVFAIVVISLGALSKLSTGYSLSIMGVVAAAGSFVVATFMNNIHDRGAQSSVCDDLDQDDVSLATIYQTRMIVVFAFREGVAFMNLIACLVEHNWWSMAIAAGMVLTIIGSYPTSSRVQQWIRVQRELASFER